MSQDLPILFTYPGYEDLGNRLLQNGDFFPGSFTLRAFPDQETYLRLESPVAVEGKDVILLCGLDHPNSKAMDLLFFSQLAREYGAKSVGLVAPYLGYMRQDKRFREGESVTSVSFARFISENFDWLVTVDPHLHRYTSLDEIYSIPSEVIHAVSSIVQWIQENISNPLLVGPDEESEQWVARIAKSLSSPYIISEKIRRGDRDVEVLFPSSLSDYKGHTPILLDDINSSRMTMVESLKGLQKEGFGNATCIGIHALFSQDFPQMVLGLGRHTVVTCNTVPHSTNQIDVSSLITAAIERVLKALEKE